MSEYLDAAELLKLKELYSSGIGFGPTVIALINALEKERARVAQLEEAWTDDKGTTWRPPTAWAYAQSCRVRHELEARVAKLEAALKDTAKQMMSDEMDQDQRDNADWQFGYDACVETARAALSETVEA